MHLVGNCALGRGDLYLPQGRDGWVQKEVLVKSLRKMRNREKWIPPPKVALEKALEHSYPGAGTHGPAPPSRSYYESRSLRGRSLYFPSARPEPPGEPNRPPTMAMSWPPRPRDVQMRQLQSGQPQTLPSSLFSKHTWVLGETDRSGQEGEELVLSLNRPQKLRRSVFPPSWLYSPRAVHWP